MCEVPSLFIGSVAYQQVQLVARHACDEFACAAAGPRSLAAVASGLEKRARFMERSGSVAAYAVLRTRPLGVTLRGGRRR